MVARMSIELLVRVVVLSRVVLRVTLVIVIVRLLLRALRWMLLARSVHLHRSLIMRVHLTILCSLIAWWIVLIIWLIWILRLLSL